MTERLQAILEAEGLSSLLDKFNEQGVTDSILGDLTDSDLKELGVDKLGERKRLLAAFGKSGGGAVAVSVVEESSAQTSGGAPSKTTPTPAEATKDSPWVNTLGMPFVPIPRFDTRFCIWPVRVQDYEAYCMASGADFPLTSLAKKFSSSMERLVSFPQGSDHPVVAVSWNDAIKFCVWLTGKERAEGKIDDKTVYRLPTDLEWSAAVGLPHEPEPTPAERHLKTPGYPWGLRWPPPHNAGNYEHDRQDQFGFRSEAEYYSNPQHAAQSRRMHELWRAGWNAVDQWEFTSPVGSFAASELGIFDLGGNVWEWCMDLGSDSRERVLRGNSFGAPHAMKDFEDLSAVMPISNDTALSSSWREFRYSDACMLQCSRPDRSTSVSYFAPDGGFRVVIASC